VRVDPMIHPEKARVELVAGFKEKTHVVRVGDEHEVELLSGRLPSPTSAAAVVENRIVEVENGANNAGNFVRIRILDVDDERDVVLAELVTAGAKPRRRPARREKLSAAEQTRQLRELAEDAARQSAARPPIGISPVSEEEEAEDKALSAELRGEAQPDAIIIAQGAVQHADGEGRRKRRRRRRGRGGRGQENGEATPLTPPEQPVAVGDETSGQQHRRRRRRRRGRGGRAAASGGPMPERHIFEVAFAERRNAPPPAVEAPPPSLSAPVEEPKRTKPARRRRAAPRDGVAGELEGTASPLALAAADEKPKRTKKSSTAEKKPGTRKKKSTASAGKKKTT
jgi:hypothetical protein